LRKGLHIFGNLFVPIAALPTPPHHG